MSLRIASSRIAQQALRHEIPEYLCPILRNSIVLRQRREFPLHRNPARRLVHAHAHALPLPPRPKPTERSIYAVERSIYNRHEQRTLPQQCPGCGALAQTVEKEDPGFYTVTRKSVREYLGGGGGGQSKSKARDAEEEEIIRASLQNIDGQTAESLALDIPTTAPLVLKTPDIPICDRCHNLKHHETGVSIHHPSVQSLQDTIFESPYKYNHIYHVIDAADFPMSLVPGIHRLLHLTPQRSLNRRAKGGKFYHGRKTEVSFVITRSDLLAPLKTQVDSMMPYLTTVLRDALGKAGKDVRLGNVRCVSAIRGWWTKELKEDIWGRGGGGWMLGKVNVGKSQLFQDVFPKGRRGHKQAVLGKRNSVVPSIPEASNPYTASTYLEKLDQEEPHGVENEEGHKEVEALDSDSLLPPAQPETDYPTMPLVSSLPGTTASPIRVPFGNGKGELIDLPGLSRGDLELYVQPEHRASLVMRSRIRPEQQVIKPGQSLLLGGFIRITPLNPDLIFLAYAFIPIESHLTATEKAIGTQTQTRESGLVNIALEGTGEKIGSAGMFRLKWDVTKQRTGPVTAKDAAAIKPERLPYRVLSTDILIEGCGWVELVAQVRKRPGEMSQPQNTQLWDEESDFMDEDVVDPYMPVVEVFTPEGKFVAQRRPMNAWMYTAKKPGTTRAKGRPRQSMKGDKKAAKMVKRMTVSS